MLTGGIVRTTVVVVRVVFQGLSRKALGQGLSRKALWPYRRIRSSYRTYVQIAHPSVDAVGGISRFS